MTSRMPRALARSLSILGTAWLASVRLAAAEEAGNAPAASMEPAAPVSATAIIQSTCLSQDFRTNEGSTQAWGDLLQIALDLELPATQDILFCDQISATARLDDGETLEHPYRSNGARFFRFSTNSFTMKPDLGHIEPLELSFAPPAHPSRMIASLSGTARLVVTEQSHVSHVKVTPKLNVPIAVAGLSPNTPAAADGKFPPDLILTLQDDNKFTINYRSGGCCRLRDIALLDRDGKQVPLPVSNNMNMSMSFISMTGVLSRPIASIDLTVYDTLRCGRVSFGYDDVPLSGPLDISQRRRHASWTELPLPGAFAAHVKAVDDPDAPISGDPGNAGGPAAGGVVFGNGGGGVVHVQFGGMVVAPAPAPPAPAPAPAAPAPVPVAPAPVPVAPAPAPAAPAPAPVAPAPAPVAPAAPAPNH